MLLDSMIYKPFWIRTKILTSAVLGWCIVIILLTDLQLTISIYWPTRFISICRQVHKMFIIISSDSNIDSIDQMHNSFLNSLFVLDGRELKYQLLKSRKYIYLFYCTLRCREMYRTAACTWQWCSVLWLLAWRKVLSNVLPWELWYSFGFFGW